MSSAMRYVLRLACVATGIGGGLIFMSPQWYNGAVAGGPMLLRTGRIASGYEEN
jgi:hypothetical protein